MHARVHAHAHSTRGTSAIIGTSRKQSLQFGYIELWGPRLGSGGDVGETEEEGDGASGHLEGG